MANTSQYRKISDNNWVITVQENHETKELFIEFPADAIAQVGWDEGDTLIWEELTSGVLSLKKKKDTND